MARRRHGMPYVRGGAGAAPDANWGNVPMGSIRRKAPPRKTWRGAEDDDFAEDPGRVRDLARAIAAGTLSPVALVQRYLDRIAAADPHVQCWRQVDAERALETRKEREREAAEGRIRGPLHGVPVAIKDIIDVEGLPTRANSRSRATAACRQRRRDRAGAQDRRARSCWARCTPPSSRSSIPRRPAIPTTSRTRPAARAPDRRPPWPPAWRRWRSGTQTVASVNRPAAYCGIAAFKPSTRSLSTFGITPLAPVLRYARASTAGASTTRSLSTRRSRRPSCDPEARSPEPRRSPSAFPTTRTSPTPSPRSRPRSAGSRMPSPEPVTRSSGPASPIPFERLFRLQRSTMAYEAGRALKHLLDAAGRKRRREDHRADSRRPRHRRPANTWTSAARSTACAGRCSAAWPPTSSCGRPPQPRRRRASSWTGDPKYISPWTALGGPIVSLPAGFADNGLPIGCILTARPGADAQMCAWARQLAELVA